MKQYPFKNLALNGGGVRTFVFHGALAALEEAGILPQIDRVAGTSAGAMLAAALSFRLPFDETIAMYRTIEMDRIAQKKKRELQLPSWLENVHPVKESMTALAANAQAMSRLRRHFGWYSIQYGRKWAQNIIADQCAGNGLATFAEFRERGFRDLYVTAVNISKMELVIFSAETTPKVAVADAVIMSQAIPLFFEAIRFDGRTINWEQGDYYVDGGLFSNYPIALFDDLAYVDDPAHFVANVNWQTLGLHLADQTYTELAERPIHSLRHYLENVYQAFTRTQEMHVRNIPANLRRTITMSALGVKSIDFSVQPVPEDETYQRMWAEGRKTAETWLAAYEKNYGL